MTRQHKLVAGFITSRQPHRVTSGRRLHKQTNQTNKEILADLYAVKHSVENNVQISVNTFSKRETH